MTLGQIEPVSVKRGATFVQKVPLHLKAGFHVNSNTPADDYLIPLKLNWSPGALTVEQVNYPKPQLEHYSFSQKPVSVFSGTFVIETRFKAPANAPAGAATVTGKLRYQACNERECLPPKTIDIQVPVDIQ
ncbi:MAG: hypothetical protein JO022_02430 [Acidobacteriaceae bacterium]|nr:hypothetical protein [Acidobacteriaceae bacterium]